MLMHRLKKIDSNANVLFEVLHMYGIYADNHRVNVST